MSSKITASRSPGGRLLNIEWVDSLPSAAAYIEEVARHGGSDGYVVVAKSTGEPEEKPRSEKKQKEQPLTLFVSILLRPSILPERAMMLAALGSLALTRAIRRHSSHEPTIRWISDVYAGKQQIGNTVLRAALRPTGSFNYLLVNFSLLITPSFTGNLSDIVRNVFSQHRMTLPDQVAETLITEFFTLYEPFSAADEKLPAAFLDEYRESSVPVRDTRVHILQNGIRTPATVVGIDDRARLIVKPKHSSESITLRSAAELYDPHRIKKQKRTDT